MFFFFNDTATTEIYTLSLHDALPILVFYVLADLQIDVRLLLARVVHNQDIDVPRTHRLTLLNFQGEDYIVDVGFGHLGARYPVKLDMGTEQNQGDNCYRIIENPQGEYHYQVFKNDDYFTLYIFDLNEYTEIGRAHVWTPVTLIISYAVFCLKKKKKSFFSLFSFYSNLHVTRI